MLNQALVELLGTFVFLAVIIGTGNPLANGIALGAGIFFGGAVSGGHFNPAVTVMQAVDGKINVNTAAVYIVCQVLGALAAFWYYRNVVNSSQYTQLM